MKHVARRHFFVRELVEAFQVNVQFVRTADNLADFFTKPLEEKQFFAMRNLIMNVPRAARAHLARARGGVLNAGHTGDPTAMLQLYLDSRSKTRR